MKVLENALTAHPFLAGMDHTYVRYLAECASLIQFESGRFILRTGSPAKEFYLIRSGKVSVELFSGHGGPVVIQNLEAGDVLGWSWLIPPYEWRFDARALQPTEAIVLDAETLRAAFARFPSFGHEILHRFIRVIADRLEAERVQLVTLYGAHS